MADTGIFATTAEVQRKIPIGASATANTEAYINQYISEAESFINSTTRYNWSDVYTSLNVDVKGILKMCASNLAAIYVINYDMREFPSLSYAQTHLNILWDYVEKCLKLLEDQKLKQFLEGA
jgi:hypothetical protein